MVVQFQLVPQKHLTLVKSKALSIISTMKTFQSQAQTLAC